MRKFPSSRSPARVVCDAPAAARDFVLYSAYLTVLVSLRNSPEIKDEELPLGLSPQETSMIPDSRIAASAINVIFFIIMLLNTPHLKPAEAYGLSSNLSVYTRVTLIALCYLLKRPHGADVPIDILAIEIPTGYGSHIRRRAINKTSHMFSLG